MDTLPARQIWATYGARWLPRTLLRGQPTPMLAGLDSSVILSEGTWRACQRLRRSSVLLVATVLVATVLVATGEAADG